MTFSVLASSDTTILVRGEPFTDISPPEAGAGGSVGQGRIRHSAIPGKNVYCSVDRGSPYFDSRLAFSLDSGASWAYNAWPPDVNAGPYLTTPPANLGYTHMWDVADDGTIYVVLNDEDNAALTVPSGIYASTDNGATWTLVVAVPAFPSDYAGDGSAFGGFVSVWAGPTKLWVGIGWQYNNTTPTAAQELRIAQYNRVGYTLIQDYSVLQWVGGDYSFIPGHVLTGVTTSLSGRLDEPIYIAKELHETIGPNQDSIFYSFTIIAGLITANAGAVINAVRSGFAISGVASGDSSTVVISYTLLDNTVETATSSDGGVTFPTVHSTLDNTGNAENPLAGIDAEYWLGGVNSVHLWKSIDSGATWTTVNVPQFVGHTAQQSVGDVGNLILGAFFPYVTLIGAN